MITEAELKEINKEHFKDRPNAVKFCMNCDLVKRVYCSKCAARQINNLGDLRE